jgi:hypothetical protein
MSGRLQKFSLLCRFSNGRISIRWGAQFEVGLDQSLESDNDT